MKPSEVAKLAGITVRTLQYYDKIGLLKPSETDSKKYRNYHPKDLETLQQILFFRELDFPLTQIKAILSDPNFDQQDALLHQKELLILKRDRLNQLIELTDQAMKGKATMKIESFNTKKIDDYKAAYQQEVKERWGSANAYQEYEKKTKNYSNEQWIKATEECTKIMNGFASLRHLPPDSPEALAQVKLWQNYITENYYTCTKEILAGLGLMYVQDERFKNNIDEVGEGTAEFMSKAIEAYCK